VLISEQFSKRHTLTVVCPVFHKLTKTLTISEERDAIIVC